MNVSFDGHFFEWIPDRLVSMIVRIVGRLETSRNSPRLSTKHDETVLVLFAIDDLEGSSVVIKKLR